MMVYWPACAEFCVITGTLLGFLNPLPPQPTATSKSTSTSVMPNQASGLPRFTLRRSPTSGTPAPTSTNAGMVNDRSYSLFIRSSLVATWVLTETVMLGPVDRSVGFEPALVVQVPLVASICAPLVAE